MIAGALAIRMASTPAANLNGSNLPPISGPLLLPTRLNRMDVATCNDVGKVPGLSFGWSETQSLFAATWDYTVTDTVAIMGAHTVGRAFARFNGKVEGGWTLFQSSFDSGYYRRLVGVAWDQRGGIEWRDNQNNILIPIDVELGISPSAGCPHFKSNLQAAAGSTCPINQAAVAVVQSFASDQALWWTAFVPAWNKMTEAGHIGLLKAL